MSHKLDVVQTHAALLHKHADVLEEPFVEGLSGASCPPHVKHLAELAIDAAARGYTAQGWREEMNTEIGAESVLLLRKAEGCMREVGLWPWHD